MADTFGLEIYASNKLAFAGRAKTLTIPAVDGEQAFLAQHENIVAAIIPGEMRFEEADGTKHVLAVSSGFVEMINNRVKLFCLTAESPEEIDIRRAQEAKERAEEQMRQKQSIQQHLPILCTECDKRLLVAQNRLCDPDFLFFFHCSK